MNICPPLKGQARSSTKELLPEETLCMGNPARAVVTAGEE